MRLEKETIQKIIAASAETIEVLFNPNEYRLSVANQFAEVSIPGLEAPPIQFVRGGARTLSMQLFFDTYEAGTDVREHTGRVERLLDTDPELHAPPVCLFSWGTFNFQGVLERAEQRFTLFFPSGVPARATVDVTFKEFSDQGLRMGKHRSANFDKRHTVRRGDNLSSIAGKEYGDPRNWRPIAEANAMDDPLALQPGRVLTIPAIE
jgi:nucleoid-associated protein YgaU